MPTIIDAKPGRWCAAALLVAETGRYLMQKRDAFDWIDFPGSIRVLDSMANHLQIGLPYRRCIPYPTDSGAGIRQTIRLLGLLQFPDSFRSCPRIRGTARCAFCDLMT